MKTIRKLYIFLAVGVLSGILSCNSNVKNASTIQVHNDDFLRQTGVVAVLTLSNPINLLRLEEPVEVTLYDLGIAQHEVNQLELFVEQDGVNIPSQLTDTDGDGRVDSLFFLADFIAGETKSFAISREIKLPARQLVKRTQAEIAYKIQGQWGEHKSGNNKYKAYKGGQFVNVNTITLPEFYTDHSEWIRYEGPGLESDKVGYRFYLDRRNGFDIFGKKVSQPVLQTIGLDGYESYHQMQPWGMDILKVGDSLGAGGFGFWQGEQLTHVADVIGRKATVIDNGTLRSSVKIDYLQWQVDGKKLDANALLAISAGSRLVRNDVQLSEKLPNLAVGFVAHEGAEYFVGQSNRIGDAYSYIASFGRQSLAGDNLGLAVFFKTAELETLKFDGKSRMAILQMKNRRIHYYFAAYWQGELNQGIGDVDEFKSALEQQALRLSHPLRRQLTTQRTEAKLSNKLTAENALNWSRALADSELNRKTLFYHVDGWDINRSRPPKFEYDIVGLLPFAYDELGRATGQRHYQQIKHLLTGSFVGQDGNIKAYNLEDYNIDAVAPGRVLLRLYQETGHTRYKKALQTLHKQLKNQPKTRNGAFWHKQRYPGQLWLDGVYMGMPFLAEYSRIFNDPHSIDEVIQEFKITHAMLRDVKTGLYFHGWDEYKLQQWANKNSGLSPQFWARGMGWMAMALVDVLDYIPESRVEDRQFLTTMLFDTARALMRYRDDDGTWWQVIDKPNQLGNYKESSASAMFTYFFAKAINKGYLNDVDFSINLQQFALQSFHGLLKNFILVHDDGRISMTSQCLVAGLGYGRDGSYEYYMSEPVVMNDPKGTGPFILAGVEISRMLEPIENE